MPTKDIQAKLNGNKYLKTSLKYPTDITSKGNQNIVLFNINVVRGSEFNAPKYREVTTAVNGDSQIRIQRAGSGSLRSQMSIERGTRRIDTSIAMYMPGGVSFVSNVDWSNTELGSAGRLTKNMANLGDISWSDMGNAMKEGAINITTGILQALTPLNAKSLSEFTRGTIVNPFMEMTFSGVQNRQFSFNFKFTPRDQNEAMEVEKIVEAFRIHQAPEGKYDKENNTAYWLYPSEFDITFLHQGVENSHIRKISTCVLTSISVDHSTDAGTFATFEGGYPVQTNMSLNFTEQEILTKAQIKDGY